MAALRYYLGLATTFHDPALAIVGPDGRVLFAEATERYLQYKRAPNCEPDSAPRMAGLLKAYVPAGAEIVVATTWGQEFTDFLGQSARAGAFGLEALSRLSPDLNRSLVPERSERAFIASLHLSQARAGLGTLLGLDRAFGNAALAGLKRYPHHLTHAAYGCWGGPFADAACLVVDGMGETGASALYGYRDGRLRELKRHRGRESIGFFFGLVTDLAGFDQTKGEEWKIMGLAPYGERDPDLLALLRRFYRIEGRRLIFRDAATVRAAAAEILARRPADAEERGWADLSRCGQAVFEDMMDALLGEAADAAVPDNLILSGGCALNSSYNGKIRRPPRFRASARSLRPRRRRQRHRRGLARLCRGPSGLAPGARLLIALSRQRRLDRAACQRMTPWEPRLRKLGDGVVAATAEILADGQACGLGAGPRRVRAAGAGQPLDPRRSAAGRRQGAPQRQGEVPRGLPALRALDPARARPGLVRGLPGQPLHGAHPALARGRARQGAGGRARGRDRTPAERHGGAQSALSRPDRGLSTPSPACRCC